MDRSEQKSLTRDGAVSREHSIPGGGRCDYRVRYSRSEGVLDGVSTSDAAVVLGAKMTDTH